MYVCACSIYSTLLIAYLEKIVLCHVMMIGSTFSQCYNSHRGIIYKLLNRHTCSCDCVCTRYSTVPIFCQDVEMIPA